jgi:hypothetical protein
MDGFTPSTYGDRIAGHYDDFYAEEPPSAEINMLAELAGRGPALELGIGTGQVALPLHDRGITVEGIDASEAMVGRLRAKPGGTEIPVTIADFAAFDLGRQFTLVYVPANTFFCLLTQDAQVNCFRAVAAHLVSGGRFLIEAFVPDLQLFDHGQRTATIDLDVDTVAIDSSRIDPATQRVDSQLVVIRDDQMPRTYPVALRYAWPSELDLMARLAGMHLEHRWGNWTRQRFDSSSTGHISVWQLDS